ncbi:MAG: hypothetical protein SV377_02225, partial [Halobacteria archaeon]|nr:hypothetical protein [Halobacteria archaeon]
MIHFNEDVYDRIVEHAKEGDPYEVCGILAGKKGDDG